MRYCSLPLSQTARRNWRTKRRSSLSSANNRRRRMLLLSPRKVRSFELLTVTIEKDYENRIDAEYRYFEYVNTIRLLSRELFTQVNPDSGAAASRIDSILSELKKKLFNYNE